jgi:hypothetical protein
VQIFTEGQIFTVPPKEAHNVYMFAGSAIHTLQHGMAVPNPEKASGVDWFSASPSFDAWSKKLSEADMEQLDAESMYRHS